MIPAALFDLDFNNVSDADMHTNTYTHAAAKMRLWDFFDCPLGIVLRNSAHASEPIVLRHRKLIIVLGRCKLKVIEF